MLSKYIKSVLWRVAKRLSYIEEARCLKVKHCDSPSSCVKSPHLCYPAQHHGPASPSIPTTFIFRLDFRVKCQTNAARINTGRGDLAPSLCGSDVQNRACCDNCAHSYKFVLRTTAAEGLFEQTATLPCVGAQILSFAVHFGFVWQLLLKASFTVNGAFRLTSSLSLSFVRTDSKAIPVKGKGHPRTGHKCPEEE